MGMFGGIKDASMTGGGNNFRDGKYKCLVEKCVSHKGYKGNTFRMECRIVEAEAVAEYEIARDGKSTTDKPVKPNAVNTSASYVVNLKFDNALGNIKKAVLGVLGGFGYTEDRIDEELIDKVTGPENPLRGMAVEISTYRTVNQGRANKANEGNILVLLNFDPIEQNKDQVKAQREWLTNTKAGVAATEAKTAAPATAPATQPNPGATVSNTQPTTIATTTTATANSLSDLGL